MNHEVLFDVPGGWNKCAEYEDWGAGGPGGGGTCFEELVSM